MSDTVLSVKAQSDRGMDDHIEVVYNGHTHTTTTSVANGHTHTTPRRRPHRHTAQTVPYTPTSPPQHTPTPLSLALGKDVAVIVSIDICLKSRLVGVFNMSRHLPGMWKGRDTSDMSLPSRCLPSRCLVAA
jgi:hypothetical protein